MKVSQILYKQKFYSSHRGTLCKTFLKHRSRSTSHSPSSLSLSLSRSFSSGISPTHSILHGQHFLVPLAKKTCFYWNFNCLQHALLRNWGLSSESSCIRKGKKKEAHPSSQIHQFLFAFTVLTQFILPIFLSVFNCNQQEGQAIVGLHCRGRTKPQSTDPFILTWREFQGPTASCRSVKHAFPKLPTLL